MDHNKLWKVFFPFLLLMILFVIHPAFIPDEAYIAYALLLLIAAGIEVFRQIHQARQASRALDSSLERLQRYCQTPKAHEVARMLSAWGTWDRDQAAPQVAIQEDGRYYNLENEEGMVQVLPRQIREK